MGDGSKPRLRPRGWAGVRSTAAHLIESSLVALVLGCGSNGPERPEARSAEETPREVSLVPPACGVDQVREYRCDALLPVLSSLPAPPPYGTCPGAIEIVGPNFVPLSRTAAFDGRYTELMRRRAPPGHQCCYSWCAKLEVAEPSDVPPGGRCNEPLAFPEKACMPEPEGGISTTSAPAPFERCAAAVRPPGGSAFSVPRAASFDGRETGTRRNLGFADCCYSWCSIAPPGSGLERRR